MFGIYWSFALHAILEILILLPVIYLGFAVASIYVDFKNYFHDKLLTFLYNDPYCTRYYQVNPSLLTMANKDQQFVKDVTQLYIDNLKECDALIKGCENNVICPEKGLSEKNSILHEKSQLQQEWHAIRDDKRQFSIEDKQNLIKSRIKKNKTHEYQQLKRCFNSYADQVIVEAKIDSNKDRMSFFRLDESSLYTLKKPCIAHEEKILLLNRIYSKVH